MRITGDPGYTDALPYEEWLRNYHNTDRPLPSPAEGDTEWANQVYPGGYRPAVKGFPGKVREPDRPVPSRAADAYLKRIRKRLAREKAREKTKTQNINFKMRTYQ
jgi:hypothetical protein